MVERFQILNKLKKRENTELQAESNPTPLMHTFIVSHIVDNQDY